MKRGDLSRMKGCRFSRTRVIVLKNEEDRLRRREGSFYRTRGIVLKDEEDRPQEWDLTGLVCTRIIV